MEMVKNFRMPDRRNYPGFWLAGKGGRNPIAANQSFATFARPWARYLRTKSEGADIFDIEIIAILRLFRLFERQSQEPSYLLLQRHSSLFSSLFFGRHLLELRQSRLASSFFLGPQLSYPCPLPLRCSVPFRL